LFKPDAREPHLADASGDAGRTPALRGEDLWRRPTGALTPRRGEKKSSSRVRKSTLSRSFLVHFPPHTRFHGVHYTSGTYMSGGTGWRASSGLCCRGGSWTAA